MEYKAVDTFCWNVRDTINSLFLKDLLEKQNMSNKEKKTLDFLIKCRNMEICVNDKNLGAISANILGVITECLRLLYDVITYNNMSWEEAKNLIDKIKFDMKNIIRNTWKKVHIHIKKQNFCYLK